MTFDNATAAFELCFVPAPPRSPPVPTEIFVSFARRYPAGADIAASAGLRFEPVPQNNTVLVFPVAGEITGGGGTECIKITRKVGLGEGGLRLRP